jgi:hypothetical protein
MPAHRTARASLFPLLLLASGTATRCELSTDAGTGELRIVGTVRFLESESGCWQVETDDGRRYELSPEQAPPTVLRDGARVFLVVQPSGGSARACRSALPVEVRQVMSVEELRHDYSTDARL